MAEGFPMLLKSSTLPTTLGHSSIMGQADLDLDDSNPIPLRVRVLLPLPLKGVLDYRLPPGEPGPAPGTIVQVPLSGRSAVGVVWDGDQQTGGKQLPLEKLKPIEKILLLPPMAHDLRKFVDWVAAYTLSSAGAVLRMALSSPAALAEVPVRTHYVEGDVPEGLRITTARQSVLDVVGDDPLTGAQLAEKAGVSTAVVSGLAKTGALRSIDISVDRPFGLPDVSIEGPELSSEQEIASQAIRNCVQEGGFKSFLLDGITGSGKTEVYFEGLIEALKESDAQVLVLVPEIALTSQWLTRFETRFGTKPVVWHSDIGIAARRRAWRSIASGQARVVVGARSALFLPFKKLDFITVDEEHDPSFKQEEGVLYHARDMAIVRAKLAGCPIVLASATPSLETLVNADSGKYEKLVLRERFGAAILPAMKAIDLRADVPAAGQWLAPRLIEAMKQTIVSGEQVMLFLNRRGYAPLTLCRTCGHRIECPSCSTWLVEHRFRKELQCHQCGFVRPSPEACPECESEDSLVACGPGVERLFEEVNAAFGDARIAVMTSDTMTNPRLTAEMVGQIADGQLDIVIGTQIVTKGYHFPNLTLVGVIDADLGLRGGDLRAGERTYQQLVQVAGRAGRAEKPGTVYLQTYEPEHPVVQALLSGDGDAFMKAEQEARQRYNMPPFGQLTSLILSGTDMAAVFDQGRLLATSAPSVEGVSFMGPAPAPLARVRGLHRVRMLVHGQKRGGLQQIVREWVQRTRQIKGVKIKIDIDPYSFL